MKQFHNEQEKVVVYVQVKDLRFLVSHTNERLPKTVYSYFSLTKDMNSSSYIRFDDMEAVMFFKYAAYIIDYEACKMNSELLASVIASLIKLADVTSDLSKKEHSNLKWLSFKYECYLFAIDDLQKIQAAKDAGTIEKLAFPGISA